MPSKPPTSALPALPKKESVTPVSSFKAETPAIQPKKAITPSSASFISHLEELDRLAPPSDIPLAGNSSETLVGIDTPSTASNMALSPTLSPDVASTDARLSTASRDSLASPSGSVAARRSPRHRPSLQPTHVNASGQPKLDSLAIMAMLANAREAMVNQANDALASHGECPVCKKTVIGNDFKEMQGSVWHVEHFRCSQCSLTMDVKDAQLYNDRLFCAEHFVHLCCTCRSGILPGEKMLKIQVAPGETEEFRYYHQDCFACEACSCDLSGGFVIFNGMALCPEDYFKAAGFMCGICGEKITEGK